MARKSTAKLNVHPYYASLL